MYALRVNVDETSVFTQRNLRRDHSLICRYGAMLCGKFALGLFRKKTLTSFGYAIINVAFYR